MRKLKQIEIVPRVVNKHGVLRGEPELMALDENGELWHGTLEITEDSRRVIDWTPVNTPRDGAAFTEPQLSFFDKWEKEAHGRLQTEADERGEAVPLATEDETDASGTG